METCHSAVKGDVVIICVIHWLQKEEPYHFDQSFNICAANYRWNTVAFDSFMKCDGSSSHLHLLSMETHEPLDSDFFACARVVDVFPLLQTALVHPHVRQLAEPPSLLMKSQETA